jgi:hypothetical protein
MMETRRQRYERRGASVQACGDNGVPDSSGPWPELHAEIARLAEKYRVPIVLCYFEGLTHDQAAARLGWPLGTVKTRLARARDQLRRRLENRGFSSAVLMPAEYLRPRDVPSVPRPLLELTTRAAARFVSGAGAGEFLSSAVLVISQGVLKAMLINKMKLAKDKLLIYGLTEAEIETAKNQDGVQKARMILRSSADGVVVTRNVVLGNYYTTQDTLLVIAARDALIVRASVDSRDAGKLEVGQRVTLRVPFVDRIIVSKVEAISWDAESETGKVLIRTTIDNLDHRLKAGMLVRLGVDLGLKAQATRIGDGLAQEKPHLSLEERLNEVERKLERLLDQNGGPAPNAEILGRLNELERKLDRALNLETGK